MAAHRRAGVLKSAALVLGILAALAILIGAPLLALRAQRGVKCPDQVLIVRGRSGPIECICLDGVLATCFDPGP